MTASYVYRADGERPGQRWRPSIFMPRVASRLLLSVERVRVERLQSISAEDAIAEGLTCVEGIGPAYGVPGVFSCDFADPIDAYRELWESLNGPGSWDRNPLVWVVEFRVGAEPEPDVDELPILFSAPMIRALSARLKNQTRRVLNLARFNVEMEPDLRTPYRLHRAHCGGRDCDLTGDGHELSCGGTELLFTGEAKRSPYGARGDRLWVKETFA